MIYLILTNEQTLPDALGIVCVFRFDNVKFTNEITKWHVLYVPEVLQKTKWLDSVNKREVQEQRVIPDWEVRRKLQFSS